MFNSKTSQNFINTATSSYIENLKRLAKKNKKANSTTIGHELDLIAEANGFTNWALLIKRLKPKYQEFNTELELTNLILNDHNLNNIHPVANMLRTKINESNRNLAEIKSLFQILKPYVPKDDLTKSHTVIGRGTEIFEHHKDTVYKVFDKIRNYKQGFVTLSGISGIGKTTFLKKLVEYLIQYNDININVIANGSHDSLVPKNARKYNCMFIEQHVGTNLQSCETGLIQCLRRKPSIIIVSELQNEEQLKLMLDAAATGHLVICGSVSHFQNNILAGLHYMLSNTNTEHMLNEELRLQINLLSSITQPAARELHWVEYKYS